LDKVCAERGLQSSEIEKAAIPVEAFAVYDLGLRAGVPNFAGLEAALWQPLQNLVFREADIWCTY
jgi:hypothetical protein